MPSGHLAGRFFKPVIQMLHNIGEPQKINEFYIKEKL